MIRRLGTLALVGLLALSACSASVRSTAGQVTATASVNPFAVKVGDCLGGKVTQGTASGATLIPCEQPHAFETFASTQLPDGSFPGTGAVDKAAEKFCSTEFTTFVGIPANKSGYRLNYLVPVEDSWVLGDREVLCLVGNAGGGITGSLRGVQK